MDLRFVEGGNLRFYNESDDSHVCANSSDEEQVFLSTQVQGRLDDIERLERQESNIADAISGIQKFANPEGDGGSVGGAAASTVDIVTTVDAANTLDAVTTVDAVTKNANTTAKKVEVAQAAKTAAPVAPAASAPAHQKSHRISKASQSSKIKSITSFNTNKFGNSRNTILKFLSGKKHKIKDIIARIGEAEEGHVGTESQHVLHKTYSEQEWQEILKAIKVRFPNLSTRTRESIQLLHQTMYPNVDNLLTDSQRAPNDPAVEELYDVGNVSLHQEMSPQFACSLSQLVRQNPSDDENDAVMDDVDDSLSHISNTTWEGSLIEFTSSQVQDYRDFLLQDPLETFDRVAGIQVLQSTHNSVAPTQRTCVQTPEKQSTQHDLISIRSGGTLSIKASATNKTFAQEPVFIDSRGVSPIRIGDSAIKKISVTQESFRIPNMISPLKKLTQSPNIVPSQLAVPERRIESWVSTVDKHYTKSRVKYYSDLSYLEDVSPFIGCQTNLVQVANTEIDCVSNTTLDDRERCYIEVLQEEAVNNVQVPSSEKDESDDGIDFGTYSTQQLKDQLIDIGLKPLRSRAKMIQALENTHKVSSISQSHVKEGVLETISNLVRGEECVYEKVITFEPVPYAWFNDFLVSNGCTVDEIWVREWAELHGVCFVEDKE